MFIILMGVSGSGKTTVGRLLADRLGWPFHDADDFHPPENVEKMRAGIPLTDADRVPWLKALAAKARAVVEHGDNAILACSALSRAARLTLNVDPAHVRFVHLHGSKELIRRRLDERKGHYMPPTLLDSQFATLEDPGDEAVTIDIGPAPEQIVTDIRRRLHL